MNRRVPELNMGDEDYSPPAQNNVQEDSIMELLWRDGQVVVQTQNPRLVNQSFPPPPPPSAPDSWLEGRDLYQSDSRTNTQLRETTVVDSCDTPAVNLSRMEVYSRSCDSFSGTVDGTSSLGDGCMSISMSMSRDAETILTSSPDGSSDSDTPPPVRRKRKSREPHDDATTDYHTERRRDKINEKLKALQDLIPRCSKTDKVSTLDEAIQYLKELQIQVQVMAIGCGMVPMMFPGAQQYMPTMGMGIGMPMGMGMTHPMIPYQAVLSGSCLPTPGAPSQMDPRFPLNAFPVPQLHFQPSKQADAFVNPLGMPGHNVAMTPSLAEAYQQYIAMQKIPLQIPETQPTSQPGTGEESTSSDDQDDE